MQTLTDMLTALGNADPTIRVPAEQAIERAKDENLAGFITAVLAEFQDDAKPPFVRHMAGTLLKNAVAPSLREVAARQQLEERWKQLPAGVRQDVKNQVLTTLGSANREVRNVAANLIGSLSRIELPAGEWPDLISILVRGAQSGSEQHQEAALTTIGYICEEGQDHDEVEEVLQQYAGDILNVIVTAMQSPNEEIKHSATRALCNAMEYISNNMQNQEQRDYLIGALCTTASTCQASRTREIAMQALVKVADLYYDYLPTYIQKLSEISSNAIFNDSEEVGLQAMLFWQAICDTEREFVEDEDMSKSHRYAEQGMAFLVDICLRTLVMQDESLVGEEEWNLSVAGGKLLQTLAEAIGQMIHKPVMDYTFAKINSENWRERDAALMAFGCILGIEDHGAREAIQDTVAQAAPGLLAYLRDSNEHVADTASWVTAVVCECFPDIFLLEQPKLQELMNIVGPMLVHSESHVARRACTIINNLALAFEDEEDQHTNPLSFYYTDIVGNLLRAIDNGNSIAYRTTAQETLNAVVDAAAEDCKPCLLNLAPELLQRLGTNAQALIAAGGNDEALESLVSLLCGAVSAIARKLGADFIRFVDQAMQMLIALINMPVDYVQDEVLIAIGALAYGCKQAMEPYLSQIVPYVLRCLQNFDEPDVQTAVVACIGDLAIACGDQMHPYVADIMNVLYNSLIDVEVDRDTKVTLLSCFSDVIVNIFTSQSLGPYLQSLMELLEKMFNLSCQIDTRGDPDSEEYVMALWESTAAVYTAVLQTYRGDEVQGVFPYLSGILRFSLHAASNAGDFTETAVTALMVLGDMANVMRESNPTIRQHAKTALFAPQVTQVITDAQRNPGMSKDDKKNLKWIMTQLNKLQNA